MGHLLEVQDLVVKFGLRFGDLTAIDGVSFTLDKREKMGLVGESGAGKSVTGFAIINLLSKPGYIAGGRVLFEGVELNRLSDHKIREIRGNRISMIFQDPMMTLNPVLTIGTQMIETVLAHKKVSKAEAIDLSIEKLKKVYIPSPEKRLSQYPHECSGGMRQRVGLARALVVNADILLMDEPFSAVDEQNRRKFQEDLLHLLAHENKSVIFVTHSIEEAVYVSDQIVILSPRPGRVHSIIRPEISHEADPEDIRRDKKYLDTIEAIWADLRKYLD